MLRRSRGFGRTNRLATSALLIGLVALVAFLSGAARSGAGTTIKPFTANFSASAPGGATTDLHLLITDQSSNQSLGSANVTAASSGASQFSINSASINGSACLPGGCVDSTQTFPTTLLKLRNLSITPGTTLDVTINVTTPCTTAAYTWGIQAKQSNDFNGTGNNFTLQAAGSNLTTTVSAGCHVAFYNQPKDTNAGAAITDNYYSSGGPVKVGLYDANNNLLGSCPTQSCTATITASPSVGVLGGTTTQAFAYDASASGMIAAFNDVTISTGNGLASTDLPKPFNLQASGLGTNDTSSAFNIAYDGTSCVGQQVCTNSTPLVNSQVDTVATGGNFIFVVINSSGPAPPGLTQDQVNSYTNGGCQNYIGWKTGEAGFTETDSRNGDGTLDFTYYIKDKDLKKVYGTNYGQPNVPICAGTKLLVNNQPVNCDDPSYPNQRPWDDRTLGSDGKFPGANNGYDTAKCGSGGYWWGILGTKLDPNPPIDQSFDPFISGWGTSIDGVFRTFTLHVSKYMDYRVYP
jgi:hypothetical protein